MNIDRGINNTIALSALLVLAVCVAFFIGGRGLNDSEPVDNSSIDWASEAKELNEDGQFALALHCIDKALELEGAKLGNYRGWFLKGEILMNLSDLDGAIECYNRSIDIYPLYADSWKRKGDVLREKGKYAAAIDCYNMSMFCLDLKYNEKIDEDEIELLYKKGLSWSGAKDYQLSIHNFAEGIEKNSTDDDCYIWYEKGKNYLFLGKDEHDKNKIFMSLSCFKKAYGNGSDIDDDAKIIEIKKSAIFAEGIAYLIHGNFNGCSRYDYQKAIDCFNIAIDQSNENSDETWNIFFCKGVALSNMGRFPEAIEAFSKAERLKNDIGIVASLKSLAFSVTADILSASREKSKEALSLLSYLIHHIFSFGYQPNPPTSRVI